MSLKPIFNSFVFLLFFTFSTTLFAQEDSIFAEPVRQELVIDNAHVFSETQIQSLKAKLHQFSNETSTQILVYTTPDLMGYDIADFAQQLGEKWGVGGKFDNGIVIVFKPKNEQPGRVTIQTGYGIEALIPDATANQIITKEMVPAFKQGDVYGGIDKAVNTCMALTKGEYTAEAYKEQGSSGGAILIFIIFIITFISIFGRSRSSKYNNMGTRSNLPLWAALFMLGSGSNRGSGFSDFSKGSGSFGGGSSFGGFGGGSFGGGGASGSW